MVSKEVRTRFAPSPTGYMHVGNLRTALYAYLVAKQANGKFLLRIEDTDQEREVEGAVDVIYNTLKTTGLIHDEGPDIGGDFGTYIQSQRLGIYKKHALKLVDSGHAYYCFCTKERLDELRETQELNKVPPKYDGHCFNLSKEEIDSLLKSGAPYVIRQRIPASGETTFTDEVYGSITVENSSLDDQVLLKSDGYPTYNFANVVDDHLMQITHVLRMSEYLSSTPKYNLLYESFGWEIPKYVHCSPVMRDATHKLSKRHGDASFEDLLEKGYLKEAILNYIALLGWSPKDEKEIFSLPELVRAFSIDGISKSPSIFDIEKLNWLNGEYLRMLSPEEFLAQASPFIDKAVKKDVDKPFLCSLLQPRCEKLTDIIEQLDFIDVLPEYSTDLFTHKKMKTDPENSLEALKNLLPAMESIDDFTFQNIHDAMFALVEKLDVKNGLILWPLRVALSGKAFTPGGGTEIAALLGKGESVTRIKKAIDLLEKS